MSVVERKASVTWEGTIASGAGEVAVASEALGPFPLDWEARWEDPRTGTSPEELLAAAHAGCYAMALSHVLANHGHHAERLEVVATTSLEQLDVGYRIATARLEVSGDVADIDPSDFERIAQEADLSCPVSNALRDNVEIEVRVAT